MKHLIQFIFASIVITQLFGCANSHQKNTAIKNETFIGNNQLSLGGNLELLAGNDAVESKNRDDKIDSNDVIYLKEATEYESVMKKDAYRAASLALTAKYLMTGFAVTEFLENPADYPKYQIVVLLPLNDSDNPSSEAMLRKAWTKMTDPTSSDIKATKCNINEESLVCEQDSSSVGTLKFTYIVDQAFIKKLNPDAKAGKYAAYGFAPSVWTTHPFVNSSHSAKNEPDVINFFARKYWYTQKTDNTSQVNLDQEFTYHVTDIDTPDLRTVVYIYDKQFKNKKIAELR